MAATEEDPGGAEGWSIADQSHYLTVSSDARTWTAYDETASFRIQVKEGAVTAATANTPATGLPAISGTPQVGTTLTVDTSVITDEDGLDDVSYSYHWIVNDGTEDSDIEEATSSTYTPSVSDVGKTIRVRVSFNDDADNDETLTSEATEAVAAKPNSEPAGLPTISGTPQVGVTLTADTLAITDEDGLDDVSFSYQWIINDGTLDADIEDATDSTYTPSASDEGKTIKVKVSFTDDADNDETLASAATVAVAAKANSEATGLPTISGTPQVGVALTAHTSAITDGDGLDDVTYSYQWLAGGSDIDGATGPSYTPTASQKGQTIQVRVTFTDDDGNAETLTSVATEAVAAASNREATGLPTISGTPQVGETLTASTSAINDEDGLENASYSYQWLADGVNIAGATRSSYVLANGDAGKTIKVSVSFTDERDNAETLTSVATGTVDATVPTAPQSLSVATGDQVQELDASWQAPSSNGGSAVTGYKVQWKESAESWETEADVSEATATGTTHTITGLTGGVEYSVRVIATNIAGDGPASTEVKSTPAGGVSEQVVEPENTASTGLPTIGGTPQVDQTLTADTSPIDDADGLTNISWQYQWIAGGSDIGGATGSTHTLTYSEQGQTIRVRVTFTDDEGNEETLTSIATAAVAAAPNRGATGAPAIGGTPQVDQTLTADTANIVDEDGLTNVSYSYQWIAGGSDIDGATGASHTLTASEQGETIQVRVTFTDDRNNGETLTSIATAEVEAAPVTLTVLLKAAAPASHDGSSEFTFEIEFSEEFGLSYRTLKFHAFNVTGGSVERAQRTDKPSNIPWLITIKPQGDGDVTVELPATTDCNADGAICTGDGRKLSNSLSITVSGPGQ